MTKVILESLAKRPTPDADRPCVPGELAAAALTSECARVDGEFAEEEQK